MVVEEAGGEAQREFTRTTFNARVVVLLVEPASEQTEHEGVHGHALPARRLSKLLANMRGHPGRDLRGPAAMAGGAVVSAHRPCLHKSLQLLSADMGPRKDRWKRYQ